MNSPEALLDTSVFIALESGRALDPSRLPEAGHVSVVTLGELQAGVFAAKDTEARARRLETVEALAGVRMLPVTADVARQWARLRYRLAEAGRRINVNDLWIASTALAFRLSLVTQDQDYGVIEGLGGPEVVYL